jgi:hypothetical protein
MKNRQKSLLRRNIFFIPAPDGAASERQVSCDASFFFMKLSYSMHTLRRNHQTSCLIHE